MFCQLCRVKAEEGARFCGACGTALGTSSAPQDAISVAERPHPKPKSPGAALLLSLFVPGLGLVYGGKPWWWGLLELLAVLGTACLSWPLAIGFYLFCAIEAYVRVERSGMRCSSCGAELPAFARYCTVCGDARPLPDDSTRPTFENPRTVEVKESKGVSPKTLVLFVAAALITGGIAALGGKVLLEQFRRASGATPPTSPTTSPKPGPSLSVLLNGLQMGIPPSSDMTLQENTTSTFFRSTDREDVLGVPVKSTRYVFYGGNRLWIVNYDVSAANAAPLLNTMRREYGEPGWTGKDKGCQWYEPKGSDIKDFTLSADYGVEETGEAYVRVISGPINREDFFAKYPHQRSVVAGPGIAVVRGTTEPDPGDVTSFLVGTIYGDQNLPQSESLKLMTVIISQLCPTCSFKRETMSIVSYEQGSVDIGEHSRNGIQIRRIKCGAIVALFDSVEEHTNKTQMLCFLVSAAGDPTTGTWHWVRGAPCKDAAEFVRQFRDLPGYEKDDISPSIQVPH